MRFQQGDIIVKTTQPNLERKIIDVFTDLRDSTVVTGYLWGYPDLEPADDLDNRFDSRRSDDPLLFWWRKK